MADSYTLRASDVTDYEAARVHEAAYNDLFGLGYGKVAEAMQAVADTLATSDGTVHIRVYYKDQGNGSG